MTYTKKEILIPVIAGSLLFVWLFKPFKGMKLYSEAKGTISEQGLVNDISPGTNAMNSSLETDNPETQEQPFISTNQQDSVNSGALNEKLSKEAESKEEDIEFPKPNQEYSKFTGRVIKGAALAGGTYAAYRNKETIKKLGEQALQKGVEYAGPYVAQAGPFIVKKIKEGSKYIPII